MNTSGTLITLSESDGMIDCHLGNYGTDNDLILKAKFWSLNVPLDKVVSYHAVVQRNIATNEIYLEIKSYAILADFAENMEICSFVHSHGMMKSQNEIQSYSWHLKEEKSCGNLIPRS